MQSYKKVLPAATIFFTLELNQITDEVESEIEYKQRRKVEWRKESVKQLEG